MDSYVNSLKLIKGNCLDVMKDIPDCSVDMILCDLPYGITQNKSIIPCARSDFTEWRYGYAD